MPILAGDPEREQIRALARRNRSGLGAAELALIRLGEGLPRPVVDALNEELVARLLLAVA